MLRQSITEEKSRNFEIQEVEIITLFFMNVPYQLSYIVYFSMIIIKITTSFAFFAHCVGGG